jgi:hypothetical protein
LTSGGGGGYNSGKGTVNGGDGGGPGGGTAIQGINYVYFGYSNYTTNPSMYLGVYNRGIPAGNLGFAFACSNVTMRGALTVTGYTYLANNVGINTTAEPAYSLDVNGTIRATGYTYLANNVGINTLSPAYSLDVNGTIRATVDIFIQSDKRVKENVSAIHGISFDTLNSIQAYKYRYVGSPQCENHIGVMAQELETLFPECVIENQGTKYVNYSALTVILLQAVKDLNARVKVLENRAVREDV